MNHLLVYAHPNPASFNHAIHDTIAQTLEAQGHAVVVRDLYTLNFNPVLSGEDFAGLRSGTLPADIKAEQEHVAWADVISFVYPTWWVGMPAILKGYIDRVFSYGFAFSYGAEGPMGLLKGKKAFLVSTGGNPEQWYTAMQEALHHTADGNLKFCGIEVLAHKYLHSVPSVDDATRHGMLADVQALVQEVATSSATM